MEKSLKTHPQIIVDTIIIIITFLMQNSGVAELCVWNPRYLRARSLFFLCLELTKTLVVTKVNFLRSRTNRQQQRCRRRVYNLFRKKKMTWHQTCMVQMCRMSQFGELPDFVFARNCSKTSKVLEIPYESSAVKMSLSEYIWVWFKKHIEMNYVTSNQKMTCLIFFWSDSSHSIAIILYFLLRGNPMLESIPS